MVTEPRDELAAAGEIISSDGAEDFSAFASSRWPRLVRLAFGLTGDRWAAEDLAQTTLARAYLAWHRVSRADDPDAYLRRILLNASNRRFRRRRVDERTGDPPELPVDGPADLVGERATLLAALRHRVREAHQAIVNPAGRRRDRLHEPDRHAAHYGDPHIRGPAGRPDGRGGHHRPTANGRYPAGRRHLG
jgi:hypothetical protein